MKDLRKLAEIWYDKNSMNYKGILSRHNAISMITDFHEQANKDMYPKEFVEWLLTSCDTGIDDDETQMKWIVEVETHVIEYMTTKQALKFWKDNIQGK